MPTVPVFYATTDGHTRRIAEHVATVLRGHRLASQAIDVTSHEAATFAWGEVVAVVLAASVHAGHHQRTATAFVERHRDQLAARPSLFLSVSLNICSNDERAVASARRVADEFGAALGWRPARVACIGGCLAYREYGFLTRWMMRRLAAKSGGPTDTSRDHVMTDWPAVTALADDLALVAAPPRAAAAGRR